MVSVQALRATAAMSVVLVHFEYVRDVLSGHPEAPLHLYWLSSGVDLFFVISGFIMVYSSERLFAVEGGWRTFLARRISRIVPLYWLATFGALAIMSPPQTLASVTRSLLFIPYRTGNTYFPTHAGGWTLNFEMFFYCVFSAVLFLPRKIAVPVAGLALSIFVALGTILQTEFAPIAFWSDPIILEFIFGMAIALLYRYGVQLPAWARVALISLGIIGLYISAPSSGPPSGNRWYVWGLPTAAIFAGVTLGRDVNFWRLTAPIKLLGDASYALYLIHPMVAAVTMTFWLVGPFGLPGLAHIPMNYVLVLDICAAILLAILIHLFFERNATTLLRQLGQSAIAPAIAGADARSRP
jgi:exopolysaccharide production protein ExoZ